MVILICTYIAERVNVYLLKSTVFECVERVLLMSVWGPGQAMAVPGVAQEHSEVAAQLKQTCSPLCPLTRDGSALYQEHTLPGIPFKNIFNRWVNQGEKKSCPRFSLMPCCQLAVRNRQELGAMLINILAPDTFNQQPQLGQRICKKSEWISVLITL